jgi:hypothetical protein
MKITELNSVAEEIKKLFESRGVHVRGIRFKSDASTESLTSSNIEQLLSVSLMLDIEVELTIKEISE